MYGIGVRKIVGISKNLLNTMRRDSMKPSMQRVVALVTMLGILSSCALASASSPEHNGEVEVPRVMTGYLYDRVSGETIEIEGKLVETDTVMAFSEDSNEGCNTYEFVVYADVESNQLTKTKTNNSYAVTVNFTIYYNNKDIPALYLLTAVSGNWTIDAGASNVMVNDAIVEYTCTGVIPPATQYNEMHVGNNFYVSTGFQNYIHNEYAALGGALHVFISMGGSGNYEFVVENYYFY